MIIRICGVLITDKWDVRRAARRIFPYSPRNARKWVRAFRFRPSAPRVRISCAAVSVERFERQSGIPMGTQFLVSSNVEEFTERKKA